jgi:hypothetical protein
VAGQALGAWRMPALLLIWPLRRHIAQRFTKATIAGDKLRYEVGALCQVHAEHLFAEGAGRARGPDP